MKKKQMQSNKERYAVIVIDMLEDLVYGALKNERSHKIIKPLQKLLDHARKNQWLVIYSNDAHLPGDPEEKSVGTACARGKFWSTGYQRFETSKE